MVAFNQKTKNFEIYPPCPRKQTCKVHISSCVCFYIKFCFYLCKFAKATSKTNAVTNLTRSLQIYYRIFYQKAKNFKFYLPFEAWAWMLFYNVLSFYLTQKSSTSWNLTPKNPVNLKIYFHTFHNSAFRTKKTKFIDLFNNKFKRLWNFSSQIYREILLIDLIKQLFDLFKRKGLFWALF